MEVEKKCENCHPYHRLHQEHGDCRYIPPRLGHDLEPGTNGDGYRRWGVWPVVEAADWCSKFELPLV